MEKSGSEEKIRRERIILFNGMRADLGLSQSEMAAALHVSTKTVQGWEIGNPLTGTYRRNNEGDYRCDESTVKRMLAEQIVQRPPIRY